MAEASSGGDDRKGIMSLQLEDTFAAMGPESPPAARSAGDGSSAEDAEVFDDTDTVDKQSISSDDSRPHDDEDDTAGRSSASRHPTTDEEIRDPDADFVFDSSNPWKVFDSMKCWSYAFTSRYLE